MVLELIFMAHGVVGSVEILFPISKEWHRSSQVVLSLGTILCFLSSLKYAILFQQLGQLTIMIFGVIFDLRWISLVFLGTIIMFSIQFSSLFPEKYGGGLIKTFLNLLAASLGSIDIREFDDSTTTIIFYSFIVLENVVIYNLILARLSASHEELVQKARGDRPMH
jgi:hypothetical protein